MQKLSHALVALVAAAALAGCGSSSDDDNGGGGGLGPGQTTQVPQSAQQNVAGLIAYMNEVIATMTNETSEPIVLGDAVLPTSETSEPL